MTNAAFGDWILGTLADWVQAIGSVFGAFAALMAAVVAWKALKTAQQVLVEHTVVCFEDTELLSHPVYVSYNPHTQVESDGGAVARRERVTEGCFLRIAVRNSGEAAARKCLGKVLQVCHADTGETVTPFEPQRLLWSGDFEYRDIMVGDTEPLTVGYKLQHRVVSIPRSDPQQYVAYDEAITSTPQDPEETLFTLYVAERGGDVLDRTNKPSAILSLGPGEYVLKLQLSGENFKAVTTVLRLTNRPGFREIAVEPTDEAVPFPPQ